MGGTARNIRTRKKIEEALPSLPNRFTSHDMTQKTGIRTTLVSNLLKERNDLTSTPPGNGLRVVTWVKTADEEIE